MVCQLVTACPQRQTDQRNRLTSQPVEWDDM